MSPSTLTHASMRTTRESLFAIQCWIVAGDGKKDSRFSHLKVVNNSKYKCWWNLTTIRLQSMTLTCCSTIIGWWTSRKSAQWKFLVTLTSPVLHSPWYNLKGADLLKNDIECKHYSFKRFMFTTSEKFLPFFNNVLHVNHPFNKYYQSYLFICHLIGAVCW